MLCVKIANMLYPRKSGSRSLESSASSIFEQAILSGIWLSRFRERCRFDFLESNHVGSLTLEIGRAVSLRFLRKQSCWESGSRYSEGGASSIFEKEILLGV
ncbi:hypothetical protein PS1_013692 [Malus domestica]